MKNILKIEKQKISDSNLKKKLLKNNIKNIKELIFKKPVKYENYILSNEEKLLYLDKKEINLYGIIKNNPTVHNTKKNKSFLYFFLLTSKNNLFKIIVFNNFFF
jgi:RecG-like helicase